MTKPHATDLPRGATPVIGTRVESKWYDGLAQVVARNSPDLVARIAIRLHRLASGERLAPIQVEGFNMAVSPQDMCGHRLFYFGSFEPEQIEMWRRLLRSQPGAVVFDVGANIGFYTLIAAALPSVARVFSFEPSPAIAPMLRGNVALNPAFARKVSMHEIAVGADAQPVTFYQNLAEHNFGLGSMRPDTPDQQAVTVPSQRLDAFAREHGIDRVHLVKIDVEGAELLVLQGMQGLMEGPHPPRIVMEIHPDKMQGFGSTNADVFDLFRRVRYRVSRQHHDGRIEVTTDPNFRDICYLIAERE